MSTPSPLAAPSPLVAEVMNDRAASRWLKQSLQEALLRDPVDALNDALLLASVLDAQLRAVFDLDGD
jgi:predicted lipid carrier protein YhbT